jgi:hypothetical protein
MPASGHASATPMTPRSAQDQREGRARHQDTSGGWDWHLKDGQGAQRRHERPMMPRATIIRRSTTKDVKVIPPIHTTSSLSTCRCRLTQPTLINDRGEVAGSYSVSTSGAFWQFSRVSAVFG